MQVFFVESICDNPEIIAENIKVRIMFSLHFDLSIYTICYDLFLTQI